MRTIQLIELTKGGEVHNLSGHEKGAAARKQFNLSALDSEDQAVVVDIPEFVYTITPSFFQGMFAESVRKFGDRDTFLNRYRFNADPVVLQQIDHGIRASLVKRRPIFAE